jgi:exocyst complex component 4
MMSCERVDICEINQRYVHYLRIPRGHIKVTSL